MSEALAVIEKMTAIDLFKPGTMNPLIEKIRQEVMSTPRDISTQTGRKEIASIAYKVARTKTFIDNQRLALVSEEKKRLAAIDAEGKRVREELDALKEEFRQPLTEWENAEKDRVAKHEANLARMEEDGVLPFGASIERIETQIRILESYNPDLFEEFFEKAFTAKAKILKSLNNSLEVAKRAESDRVEMLRLKAEAEERERKDREERIAREAAEKARQETEKERQRIEQQKFEAEAKAKQAEEEKKLALERAGREAKEAEERRIRELEEAKERAAQAAKEAAEKAERDRIAAVEAERRRVEEQKKREEAEQKAREKDKTHKAEVNSEALLAFTKAGLSQEDAKKAVTAIVKGLIPAVKIHY